MEEQSGQNTEPTSKPDGLKSNSTTTEGASGTGINIPTVAEVRRQLIAQGFPDIEATTEAAQKIRRTFGVRGLRVTKPRQLNRSQRRTLAALRRRKVKTETVQERLSALIQYRDRYFGAPAPAEVPAQAEYNPEKLEAVFS